MFDFYIGLGIFYYSSNLFYLCCTFNQIFMSIHIAKVFTKSAKTATNLFLQSCALNVFADVNLEQSVRYKIFFSTNDSLY